MTKQLTKADLENALAAERAEREQFRKDVVDKAMALAKKHNYCDVVEDALRTLGLGDLIPTCYVIAWKCSTGKYLTMNRRYKTAAAAKRSPMWKDNTRHDHRIIQLNGDGTQKVVFEDLRAEAWSNS